MEDLFTVVIDSLRTIELSGHEGHDASFVLTVEDPTSITVVELSRADLTVLHHKIGEVLDPKGD